MCRHACNSPFFIPESPCAGSSLQGFLLYLYLLFLYALVPAQDVTAIADLLSDVRPVGRPFPLQFAAVPARPTAIPAAFFPIYLILRVLYVPTAQPPWHRLANACWDLHQVPVPVHVWLCTAIAFPSTNCGT